VKFFVRGRQDLLSRLTQESDPVLADWIRNDDSHDDSSLLAGELAVKLMFRRRPASSPQRLLICDWPQSAQSAANSCTPNDSVDANADQLDLHSYPRNYQQSSGGKAGG
jgi:hypothetical protein